MKRLAHGVVVVAACTLTVSVYWVSRTHAARENAGEEPVEVVANEEQVFESTEEIKDIDENIEEMTNYVDRVQEMVTDPHDVISLAITEIQDICMATATMDKFPGILDELFRDCSHPGARNSANIAVAESYIYLGDYEKALDRYKTLIKENLAALNEKDE